MVGLVADDDESSVGPQEGEEREEEGGEVNFPWRSQGEAKPPREAKPPGSQRSQPLSSPVPREVGLSISSRSAL